MSEVWRTLQAAELDPSDILLLACPEDGGSLVHLAAAGGGTLRCARCHRRFPIRDGIPGLLPERLSRPLEARRGGAREGNHALQTPQLSELLARNDESFDYDRLYPDEEYRHELDTYLSLLDPDPDDIILDIGAGTGRVVKEYAHLCRRVACVDFSRRSLEVLKSRPELAGRRGPTVEGDATALPFADCSFDRAVALTLVCHLPRGGLRRCFLAHVRRVLKPGGVFLVSTYHYAVVKRLWALLGRSEGALREGWQSGGRIWYRNETRREFLGLLEQDFTVDVIKGICHRVPLLSNLSQGSARRLDGACGRLGWAEPIFATELVARCRVPG